MVRLSNLTLILTLGLAGQAIAVCQFCQCQKGKDAHCCAKKAKVDPTDASAGYVSCDVACANAIDAEGNACNAGGASNCISEITYMGRSECKWF